MAAWEDNHIALVKHWAESKKEVFSIGQLTNIPGIASARYFFTPTTGPANKSFRNVKSGEVACYDALTLDNGSAATISIYLKPTTGSTEKIEIGGSSSKCGNGPYSLPSSTQTFERRNITAS